MKKFNQIYDEELHKFKISITELDSSFFNHHDAKAFVYEICKKMLASQQPNSADCGEHAEYTSQGVGKGPKL